jgi:predicted DNA-binding transcriptional regulator YafY
MRRADRLFDIIQILRRAPHPVTARAIAAELETSARTIYRDIAALISQRVPIRGAAGCGYVLDTGFDLTSLTLSADEVEAIVLGAQWVMAHGERTLARAAANMLAKMAAIAPEELRPLMRQPMMDRDLSQRQLGAGGATMTRLRAWSRDGRKVSIRYIDEADRATSRTIWPFMIGYAESACVVVAWCEAGETIRAFHVDRLAEVNFLDIPYPASAAALRRRWLGEAMRSRDALTYAQP